MKQKQTATSEVDQLKLDEFPTRAKCAGQKRLLVYLRQRQFSVAPPGLTGVCDIFTWHCNVHQSGCADQRMVGASGQVGVCTPDTDTRSEPNECPLTTVQCPPS